MFALLSSLFGLALLAVWGFSLFEALLSPSDRVRGMDKIFWILFVAAIPFVGAIAWLVAGRPLKPAEPVRPSRPSRPIDALDQPAEASSERPLGLEDSDLWAASTTPSVPTINLTNDQPNDGFETTAAKQRRLAAFEAELDQDPVDNNENDRD